MPDALVTLQSTGGAYDPITLYGVGFDLLTALANHPETARRLARKLWNFFVSELEAADPAFVTAVANEYLLNRTEMKPVVRFILRSPWFLDPGNWYARYSWPVEFVVRAIREVGWNGLSIDTALASTNRGSSGNRASACARCP